MAGGVSFLSLAYLIEISVVLNIAYRELKFPGLHQKLIVEVKRILKKADQEEIPNDNEYPEYGKLLSLIQGNGDGSDGIWVHHSGRGRFFYRYIKGRRSYKIVNFNVLLNIAILFFCTWFSHVSIPYIFEAINYLSVSWSLLFIALVATILLPIYYIHMASRCNSLLFGEHGQVYQLEEEMFARKKESIRKADISAKDFKVPEEDEDEDEDEDGDD